jgi:hypothetical protein
MKIGIIADLHGRYEAPVREGKNHDEIPPR